MGIRIFAGVVDDSPAGVVGGIRMAVWCLRVRQRPMLVRVGIGGLAHVEESPNAFGGSHCGARQQTVSTEVT
jgi:hypothetical protein